MVITESPFIRTVWYASDAVTKHAAGAKRGQFQRPGAVKRDVSGSAR